MSEKEKTLKRNVLYKGRVITLETNDVLCPNGATSLREVVRHPGGVCVLAIVDDCVVLEKQYRYPYDDFIYELPAGKLEKGEDPLKAGIRELEEETGYKAETLISYGELYPSVGYTDEIIYLYVATDIKKTKQHFDFDEDLDIILKPLNEVKEMILNNKIKDAKTLVLLLKYFEKRK